MRLSKKQREFITQCDAQMQVGFDENFKPKFVTIPFCFGWLQYEYWGFWRPSDAERFADRLVARGLVRREKQCIYYITEAGRAALTASKGGKA